MKKILTCISLALCLSCKPEVKPAADIAINITYVADTATIDTFCMNGGKIKGFNSKHVDGLFWNMKDTSYSGFLRAFKYHIDTIFIDSDEPNLIIIGLDDEQAHWAEIRFSEEIKDIRAINKMKVKSLRWNYLHIVPPRIVVEEDIGKYLTGDSFYQKGSAAFQLKIDSLNKKWADSLVKYNTNVLKFRLKVTKSGIIKSIKCTKNLTKNTELAKDIEFIISENKQTVPFVWVDSNDNIVEYERDKELIFWVKEDKIVYVGDY